MSAAYQGLLDAIGGVVSQLSPTAKAVVAVVLPAASSLINMAIAGSFNVTSIVVLATGVVTGLGVYFIPNKTKTPAPAAPAAKK